MSFNITKKSTTSHRLVRPHPSGSRGVMPGHPVEIDERNASDIYLENYTDKSFVVLGNTLSHAANLLKLGGKYNSNLRTGPGWIFPTSKRESVERYLHLGDVESVPAHSTINEPLADTGLVAKLLKELRQAFDEGEDYDGASVIDVINMIEAKYFPQKEMVIKARPLVKAPVNTSANELQMESEEEAPQEVHEESNV